MGVLLAVGIGLVTSGIGLIGISWGAVEAAPSSKHLGMVNPMTLVATALIVLGVFAIAIAVSQPDWMPGVKRAKARHASESGGNARVDHEMRWFMGHLMPTRETRAQEDLARALNRNSDLMEQRRGPSDT